MLRVNHVQHVSLVLWCETMAQLILTVAITFMFGLSYIRISIETMNQWGGEGVNPSTLKIPQTQASENATYWSSKFRSQAFVTGWDMVAYKTPKSVSSILIWIKLNTYQLLTIWTKSHFFVFNVVVVVQTEEYTTSVGSTWSIKYPETTLLFAEKLFWIRDLQVRLPVVDVLSDCLKPLEFKRDLQVRLPVVVLSDCLKPLEFKKWYNMSWTGNTWSIAIRGFPTRMAYLLYIMLEKHHSGWEPSNCFTRKIAYKWYHFLYLIHSTLCSCTQLFYLFKSQSAVTTTSSTAEGQEHTIPLCLILKAAPNISSVPADPPSIPTPFTVTHIP